MVIDPSLLHELPWALWSAFLIAAILAYPIFRILLALKSRQTVSQYAPEGHQVKQGTPTMGGLIMVSGFLIWGLIQDHQFKTANGIAYLLLMFGFGLIGFVDDFIVPRLLKGKRGLGWKQKILMQLVIAGGVAWYLKPDPMTAGILVFSILFFSNAYNFSDGLDGLAGSLGILLFGGLGVLGLFAVVPMELPVACFALCATFLPFLYLNAPPAKIFMGDVGALPLGAVMGLMVGQLAMVWGPAGSYDPATADFVGRSMTTSGDWNLTMIGALSILSVMMIVELIPVPLQILSVKLFKKKLFPYTPIHHAFEKAGWPETRVMWRFAIVQALCTAAAITLVAIRQPVNYSVGGAKTGDGTVHVGQYLQPYVGKVIRVEQR